MKVISILMMAALLAGCGGNKRTSQSVGQVTRFSTGPISKACLASDRKARNRQLCGCIQTVANMSLSPSEQRQATEFFKEPGRAQEVRQSDNPRHEVFWKRYRRFADSAERGCKGY